MRTRSGVSRANRDGLAVRAVAAKRTASTANNQVVPITNNRRATNRFRAVGNRRKGSVARSSREYIDEVDSTVDEEQMEVTDPIPRSNIIVPSSQSSNINHDNVPNSSVSVYRAPAQPSTVRATSCDGCLSSGTSVSTIFALPESEPENPISFKAALEFLPKTFDGENMSVGRFVNDCLFARNSIAAKDRHYLFLMIRSRVVGSAYNSLQDRDLKTLEDLLKHLKNTYTEHRSMSQLNTALAMVAQREKETVLQYGSRVSKILANLIELIEDKNEQEPARYMIKSARDTACENFIMGLNRDLVWRVKIGRPEALQEAINLAKQAEWEVSFENELDRKGTDNHNEGKGNSEELGHTKGYNNTRGRFRPYYNNARIRKYEASRGRGRDREGSRGSEEGKGCDGRRNSRSSTNNSLIKYGEAGHEGWNRMRAISYNGKRCYNCNQAGHIARDCRSPPEDLRECFHCKKRGHLARECPENRNESGKENKTDYSFCKKSGHVYDNCYKRLNMVAKNREEKNDDLN